MERSVIIGVAVTRYARGGRPKWLPVRGGYACHDDPSSGLTCERSCMHQCHVFVFDFLIGHLFIFCFSFPIDPILGSWPRKKKIFPPPLLKRPIPKKKNWPAWLFKRSLKTYDFNFIQKFRNKFSFNTQIAVLSNSKQVTKYMYNVHLAWFIHQQHGIFYRIFFDRPTDRPYLKW